MANIGTRTFNLIADKYLTLANEEYARTLAIGSNWTKLRLGLLLAMSTDGTSDLQGMELICGLCAGKTNPYGAAITTNFLGMKVGAFEGGGALTYNANSGNPYFSAGRALMTKVGATKTVLNGEVSDFHRIVTNTGALQRRSVHYVEFTKGSPYFNVRVWSVPLTGLVKDFTPAHLLEGLEQPTSIIVNGETLIGGPTGMAALFDEGAGALDTVDLHWNKAAFPLEVYALAAYRMS